MKNIIRISKLLLIVFAGLITGCGNNPKPAVTEAGPPTAEQLARRGEYLVAIMGCNDCHSPKQNGPQGPVIVSELMLSGYPANRPVPKADPAVIKKGWIMMVEDLTLAAGPWGISFAANLTSDQSGIGNWTEENFKRALKEGRYKGLDGSRTLLPPMPWTNFKTIADEDVSAIFAYLKSTKPVSNVVPMAVAPGDIK
jgi:hypothetical protein